MVYINSGIAVFPSPKTKNVLLVLLPNLDISFSVWPDLTKTGNHFALVPRRGRVGGKGRREKPRHFQKAL